MAESSVQGASLETGAVREPIEDRVSQPNGAIISGRYRIEGVLGTGGMGTVYLAQHIHMRKRFALKMLHAETSQVPELVARFEREAVAMSRAEHPNIAIATDFGRAENGAFFLVLEYIEGYSLRNAFASGPFEVSRVAHIARQIASALERSHELGIIHRDLKPENIMLVPRQGDVDFVKILDFGLAKLAPEAEETTDDNAGVGERIITRHGSVFGTPRYMAPEQCLGETADARSDLYALGLIVYEALTGLHPFDERNPRRMLKHHLFTPIPPMKVRNPAVNVPASMEALVLRMIEKSRDNRPASATEFLDGLSEVCAREGIPLREPSTRMAALRTPTPLSNDRPQLRPPAPAQRAMSSDADVTQDVSSSNATQDVSSNNVTQDVSDINVTRDPHDGNETKDAIVAQPARPPAAPNETQPPGAELPSIPSLLELPSVPPIEAAVAVPAFSVPTDPPVAAPSTTASTSTKDPTSATADAAKPATKREPRAPLAQAVPLLQQKRILLIATSGLLLLCLAILVFRPRKGPSERPPIGPASAITDRSTPPPIVAPSGILAQSQIDKERAAGAPALLELLKLHPTDARLPQALAMTYFAQGNGLEALRWQTKAVALQDNIIYDGEIVQAANLAFRDAASVDAALKMLERGFGARGFDVMYELSNKPGPWKTKLTQSMNKPEVRSLASPAALIALELRSATRCEPKRALLPRAGQQGDQRTLLQLKTLLQTRGCGPAKLNDCWPCLRKDPSLKNAVAGINARASLAH